MTSTKDSWRTVSVGDICKFQYGKSLASGERKGGAVRVYGSNGVIGYHDAAITAGPTIIVGRKGSHGEVTFSDAECWPIDTTYYIDHNATAEDLRWLYFRLAVLGLNKLNKAAAVPGLNREDAYRKTLLLPPLADQRRIAAILDQADALRAKRRETITQLEDLTQSIFIEMFGDPLTNPKKIKIVPLSEITTRITDGVHQKPTYANEGMPFISVRDITTGVLKFDKCKFISVEDHKKYTNRCKAEYLDILYTKVGATYGRPAIVDTTKEFSLYVSVCLIKPNRQIVDPFFLNAVLGTRAIKTQANSRIKGIGVPDLHLDQIKKFLIPLPPLGLQREFAKRVAAVSKLKTTHQASLTELDTLFASLQHRAFRGEL